MKFFRFFLSSTLAASCLTFATAQARADIIFFNNNQAAFTAAQAPAGNTLVGTETFEESSQNAMSANILADPLRQGVANGSFSNGLLQPLTIQSNTLGANATTTSPSGAQGLYGIGANSDGNPSKYVGSSTASNSLDLIFSPFQSVGAAGFNPMGYGTDSTLRIQVYNTSNVLLGSFSGVTATTGGSTYFGIQATGADRIGRINLFATSGGVGVVDEGVDNVSIYSTPEPSTWAMMALGSIVLSMMAWKRKKSDRAL